jgi:hypothetical protein
MSAFLYKFVEAAEELSFDALAEESLMFVAEFYRPVYCGIVRVVEKQRIASAQRLELGDIMTLGGDV